MKAWFEDAPANGIFEHQKLVYDVAREPSIVYLFDFFELLRQEHLQSSWVFADALNIFFGSDDHPHPVVFYP